MTSTSSVIFLPNQTPEDGIDFEVGGHRRTMFGGSFFHAPQSEDYLTINLMAEYMLPCDIHVPIRDYSVPDNVQDLVNVFELIKITDKPVYVGCFGGKGRTGLFMACFLKYLGHETPINEVRRQYRPEAVETEEQERFVRSFPVDPSLSVTPSSPASFKSF